MEQQIWLRGQTNRDGYFTLKNPASGKFLSAREDRLALEGKDAIAIHFYLCHIHYSFSC